MDLGVHVVRFTMPGGPRAIGPELARAAHVADAAGVASWSFMDHYLQIEAAAPVDEPMLEGYTSLAFVAAHTRRLRLGLLVTGVTYRHPGVLAKVVTTLDVLSRGRAELGIGAAWYEREHAALGVPFPPLAERFERLEETLQICLQMWSDDNGPYEGAHYRLAQTLCSPRPVTQPHPPILVGGGGERRTLRLVARYADACNFFAASPESVGHKLEVLRRHCDEAGRDHTRIRKTILYLGSALARPDTDRFVGEMRDYARLGIDEVMVMPPPGSVADWIDAACVPVVHRLAALDHPA